MRFILTLIFSFLFFQIHAQEDNGFKLRKSAEDYLADKHVAKNNQGAFISLTKPKNNRESILINLAGIFEFNSMNPFSNRENFFLAYSQYDRNTLIDKEQNNIILGISYKDNFLGSEEEDGKYLRPEMLASFAFRKDLENEFDAFQAKVIFSLIELEYKKNRKTYQTSVYDEDKEVDDSDDIGWNFLGRRISYILNIGLEHDYRFNGEISNLNGNLLRSFSQLKLSLNLGDDIKLYVDYQYRHNLWNTTGYDVDSFSYITTGIDHPFIVSDAINSTLGFVYVNGENPNNGFNRQSYYAINLSVKIN